MRRAVAMALAMLGLVGPRLAAGGGSAQELRIHVEQPVAGGAVVSDSDGSVFVAGRTLGLARSAERFELVLAIDTSRSTAAPAGSDVDGDGVIGREEPGRFSDHMSSDPGDSVLAAEVQAARALLSQLDPETTRLALVTFSGESGGGAPAARLRLALTRDFAALDRELARVGHETPRGRTHISAALDLAGAELGAGAEPGATRIVVLMGDGEPTLPYPQQPEANAAHALASARRLAAAGIRVDSFATGAIAPAGTAVASALAAATGGRFRTLRDPAQLVAGYEDLQSESLELLEIRNQTTGEAAVAEAVERDGRFTAVVPLGAGENWLSIRARASGGARAEQKLCVTRSADATAEPLDPRWLEPRRRLLQTRLEALHRRSLALEAEQASAARRDWLRTIERARSEPVRALAVRPEEDTAGPRTATP